MTKEELKIKRADKTQQEMADSLGAPLSSYRKWELGSRAVPKWVEDRLLVSPSYEPAISLDRLKQLEAVAAREGISVVQLVTRLIDNGLSGMIALGLLAVVSYQSLAPGDNNLLRGFRKREDITSMEFDVGEA